MMTLGVAIPGLGMAAEELPPVPGLVRLDNPEIGHGPRIDAPSYTLRDVAELHASRIEALPAKSDTFWVIGMSMGGMIASILASELRSRLPARTRFALLVTSANTKAVPAVSDAMLTAWSHARPGDAESFRLVMHDFFSEAYRTSHPDAVNAYYDYRASGANRQTPRAFMRQVTALRTFDGERHFQAFEPNEVTIVTGEADRLLGADHGTEMRRLAPLARHVALPGIGHMINLEDPAAFAPWERWQ